MHDPGQHARVGLTPEVQAKPLLLGADEASYTKPVILAGERVAARSVVMMWRAIVVVIFLCAWQFLPTIHFLSQHVAFLNRFDISSPSATAREIGDLLTGHQIPAVWPYLSETLYGAVLGTIIGLAIGAVCGLLFSENKTLSAIFRPFLVLINSIPRIALLPIVVLIVGPTTKSTLINVVLVVFFLAFFNAFEGGSNVRPSVIENVKLLGAHRRHVMRYVRLPSVLVWTFAVIPNALSFGLVIAVANEWLTGIKGMGLLLLNATSNVNSTLTFAVITILAVVGLLLTGLAALLRSTLTARMGGSLTGR